MSDCKICDLVLGVLNAALLASMAIAAVVLLVKVFA